MTPDITGHLQITRNQSLNSFTDFTSFARNVNTNETRRFDADWRIAGALHVGGAVYQFTQNNTLPVYELEDVRIDSVEGNVTLNSRADNSVSVYGRTAAGTYFNQIPSAIGEVDNKFDEREVGVRGTYGTSGETALYGELGYLSRSYDHFRGRDFSGFVCQANGNWDITGKTSIVLTGTRLISTYESAMSSYVISNELSLGPRWQVTDKTAIKISVQETQYLFRGPISATPELRKDRIGAVVLSGELHPLREVTLTGFINRSERRSNQLGLNFLDTLAGVNAKLEF